MNICFIQVEKTQESYLNEGISIYIKRLKNYCSLEVVTINVPKTIRQKSEKEQKSAEGELILKHCKAGDHLVLLDEKGKQPDSSGFSQFISKLQLSGKKRVLFVVGGPYGFSDEVYKQANDKLALSYMTFSHQMVRLFFLEQLYRGFSILAGEKYHHA